MSKSKRSSGDFAATGPNKSTEVPAESGAKLPNASFENLRNSIQSRLETFGQKDSKAPKKNKKTKGTDSHEKEDKPDATASRRGKKRD